MAKENGLGATVSVDDSIPTLRAISNDVTSFTISTPRGVQDSTGVNSSGTERILLLADASIAINGVFNDAATTGSHTVLSTIPSTSATRTVTIAHSSQSFTTETVIPDYTLTRAQTGELTFAVTAMQNGTVVPTWS